MLPHVRTRRRCPPLAARLRTGFACAAAVAAVAAGPAGAAGLASAGTHTVTDVGVPPVPGHVRSFGEAVNQSGWTVGYSGSYSAAFGANDRRAFRWTGSGAQSLGTLSGFGESIAYGINASGTVVGWASARDGNNHAFVYDGVAMRDLGTLSGKGFSAGYGINTAGAVVGTSVVRGGALHAFSWNGKKMRDLGTLPGGTQSEAWGINTSGQIAGNSWVVTSTATGSRGFIYDSSGMHDIGTLGGAETVAYDINDADSVVGKSQTVAGVFHAFHYGGGLMRDLGGIAGASSVAYGMNNRGEVVGESGGRAFLYSDGRMTDLNDALPEGSGWFLREAHDITDGGLVVGTGAFAGEYHAFLLTPTLLGRYVPQLRLDAQEVYRPDSAATITDNYTSTYTNRLLDATGTTLAASDPADPADTLSLDYLRPTYPIGRTAVDTDYVDEANDNRDADAQRMHANPAYANKVYGRVVPVAGGTLLQYWVFYYNNPKTFLTVGDHEGDWEMTQVHVDATGTAVAATYAQHETGEYCDWQRVERTQSGRPIVYAAHESHASYFTAGDHKIVVDNVPDQWDYADGAGEAVIPSLVEVTVPPLWMQWPGKWGGAERSPRGPSVQGKWNDPQGFAAGAAACTAPLAAAGPMEATPGTSPSADAHPARPRAPLIEAHRNGSSVVIDYRFESGATDVEPWILVTTVDGVRDGYTPTSERTLLNGSRHGRVVQPVALSRGTLRVLASVRATNGARSRTVVVPVE